jgi:hypothetical protein
MGEMLPGDLPPDQQQPEPDPYDARALDLADDQFDFPIRE